MAYKGTLLSVEKAPTKAGKERYTVQIDTDERGLVEFTLWDLAFVGKGEAPSCDIREMLDQRVMFAAKLGGHKKDKDGNDTDERWPSNLTLIQAEGAAEPPKPVREIAGEQALADAVGTLVGALTMEMEAIADRTKREIEERLSRLESS